MSQAPAAAAIAPGISLAQAQLAMAECFRTAGIDSPEADARVLMSVALKLSRAELIARCDRELDRNEAAALSALVARRLNREPVARIVGEKEFWSLPLRVTPDVLVPRPETETLVEAALDHLDHAGLRNEELRILDIGTGSGALLLALLNELPQARGVATDISSAALAVARSNAERLELAARCQFVACNIAEPLNDRFDLIVSNPPYIARAGIASLEPEVRSFDPRLALDGGTDGLDAYRAISASAPDRLAPTGRLIVELGIGQERAVGALVEAAGMAIKKVLADLSGIPRAMVAAPPET